MDFLSATVCQLTPGTIPWGPGWYLVAANTRVEAGPFLTEDAALHAGAWLDANALGVHPAWERDDDDTDDEMPPYLPRHSAVGLIIGSRVRDRRKDDTPGDLHLAG